MIRGADEERPPGAARAPRDLLIIAGPLLGLGVFTALLATVAALSQWRTEGALAVAFVAAVAVAAASALVLRRQVKARRAAGEALDSVQTRLSGIIESAMDAIISVDENQRIVLFNAAAEKVFGRDRACVLGQPLALLLPEAARRAHQAHVRRFGETGMTSRRMGDRTVLAGLRASGEEFPIEASISHHDGEGGKLYTVILRDITERVRTDEALRRSREELRELAEASNSVREQEKSHIARELHDELAQALTALKMDLSWMRERLSARAELADKLGSMQSLLDSTVAATRRISADLRPLMLDDLGLVPAVEWLIENFRQRTGIECDLTLATELDLRDPYATAVFRILQESLTNVARHSGATLVEVTLGRSDEEVTLAVCDDGRGFSPADPRKPHSYGLMGLRERAYLLHGDVSVASEPGRGTAIRVRIPLSEALQPT
ncbi:MAG: PAS domain S-box protein [Burkholderiales bacterium]|nr:PAS domain S-box protein [Burkholderiales bacterium]